MRSVLGKKINKKQGQVVEEWFAILNKILVDEEGFIEVTIIKEAKKQTCGYLRGKNISTLLQFTNVLFTGARL